ncbi:MAG: hypothetical protein ACOZE5_08935 [Verrucomicrobiota bacterium]
MARSGFEVGSDGKATTVTLQDEEAIPEAMRKALAGALQKAVFAPAMDHGQPVAGTYDYLIPPLRRPGRKKQNPRRDRGF